MTMTPAEIHTKYAGLIKPPPKSWTGAAWCAHRKKQEAEHGPLIAVRMTPGYDDLMRQGLGFNYTDPDMPHQPIGMFLVHIFNGWSLTQITRLPDLVEFLTRRKVIKSLKVRDVTDPAGCTHKRCAQKGEYA